MLHTATVKESYRSSLPVDVMEIDHKYDVAFMSTGSKLHCMDSVFLVLLCFSCCY